jgi:hypothetical protein
MRNGRQLNRIVLGDLLIQVKPGAAPDRKPVRQVEGKQRDRDAVTKGRPELLEPSPPSRQRSITQGERQTLLSGPGSNGSAAGQRREVSPKQSSIL